LLAVPVVVDNGGGTCDINPAFQSRKLRKLSVKTYTNTEKTNKKALGLLEDEKEMHEDMVGFDFNQEVIELLVKQKDTLAALKDISYVAGPKRRGSQRGVGDRCEYFHDLWFAKPINLLASLPIIFIEPSHEARPSPPSFNYTISHFTENHVSPFMTTGTARSL
jgi:hypothetical protein